MSQNKGSHPQVAYLLTSGLYRTDARTQEKPSCVSRCKKNKLSPSLWGDQSNAMCSVARQHSKLHRFPAAWCYSAACHSVRRVTIGCRRACSARHSAACLTGSWSLVFWSEQKITTAISVASWSRYRIAGVPVMVISSELPGVRTAAIANECMVKLQPEYGHSYPDQYSLLPPDTTKEQ